MGALCNDVERDLHSDVNLVWHHPWKLCFYSQDDQYECLLDTTSNGIYQAVHWVAKHYKSGTPITLPQAEERKILESLEETFAVLLQASIALR